MDNKLVLIGALDILAAVTEVIVAGNIHNIGQDVISLDNEVTDDNISVSACELNIRDRDIANPLNNLGDDDIAKVSEQVWLERRLSILVGAQVLEQLVHGLPESLVERVIVEFVTKEFDLIENTVGVVLVAITQEEVALIVQLVPLFGGLILKNVALLLQALANVSVKMSEETLEFWVLVGITVDGVDRIKQIIHGCIVGETFENDLQVC